MLKRPILLILCAVLMTTIACGADLGKQDDDSEISKQEAETKNDGVDYCDTLNWYGDGVCDEFCLQPDPDCDDGPVCDAVATCPAGFDELVDFECPNDGRECFWTDEVCGHSALCVQSEVACRAIPTCPIGTTQVDVCRDDAICHSETLCDTTIYCEEELAQCDALPVCPRGSIQVPECGTDAACFEQSICGETILCQREEPICLGLPSCEVGYVQTEMCPPDVDCKETTVCGQTIVCMPDEDPVTCDAIPVCADGTMGWSQCPFDMMCTEVTVCGETIYCHP